MAVCLRGWRFVKSTRSFRKSEGQCICSLDLAFINHTSDFDVVADVAVEHTAKGQRICIVGAEHCNIAGTEQQRWSIDGQVDVKAAANGVLDLFAKVGMPFLKRYTDLTEILRALRTDPKTAWLNWPLVQDPVAEAAAIEALAKQNVT